MTKSWNRSWGGKERVDSGICSEEWKGEKEMVACFYSCFNTYFFQASVDLL